MKSAGYIHSRLAGKDVLGQEVGALFALFQLLKKLGVKSARRIPKVLHMMDLNVALDEMEKWGADEPK